MVQPDIVIPDIAGARQSKGSAGRHARKFSSSLPQTGDYAPRLALSLLELRVSLGADGDVPNVHETVKGDCRYC